MQNLKNYKILITGGAGFVGTHLCKSLVKAGANVRVLDLVNPRISVPGVDYQIGDVRDRETIAKAVAKADLIFHLAAIVSVPLCQSSPLESHLTNLMGTLFLLEAVRAQTTMGKKKKVIFSSSSAVYGSLDSEKAPLSEEDLLPTPLSLYGAQKLGAEHLMKVYADSYGVSTLSFRFFNVYGPGQDSTSPYSGVISIFCEKIRKGEAIQLNGGGHQTRDFVSVHDIVAACLLAADLPESEWNGQPVNLGCGEKISIRSLAETTLKASGRNVSLHEAPRRQGDILHSRADIRKAQRLLQWKPETSLHDGLNELLSNEPPRANS